MAVFYITSDRPGAGKTALAGSLAARLSREGKRVGYVKPFSPNGGEDQDVAFLRQHVLEEDEASPQPGPVPMPEGADLDKDAVQDLQKHVEALAAKWDVVLIEGPSLFTHEGTTSPVSSALAEALDAMVLLVIQYRPGLDTQEVLRASEPFGQRLLGVLLNSVTKHRDKDVRLTLAREIDSRGVRPMGMIPEDRLMLSVTLGQVVEHLEGRWVLGQEKADHLVERFLIGGNIMDPGITYFGRYTNKAVIVRGNRPDIQLACLVTPTTCLILTGGHQPIQYVYYQAEQQEVPVLVVDRDTLETASALDTVLDRANVHHPCKIERFQELLATYADLTAIQ